MARETSYIYCLTDPIDKRIKYVGKTNLPSRRILQHIQDGKNYKGSVNGRNAPTKAAWIAHLLKKGLEPQIVILEEVPRSRWESKEKEWISKCKEAGCTLFNKAPGGKYIPPRKRDYRKKKGRKKYRPPQLH
jgi:hypothetical protein